MLSVDFFPPEGVDTVSDKKPAKPLNTYM